MQIMNNHDILKSVQGIKGGYSLNIPLEQVTYMQLVQIIEGKKEMGRICVGPKGTCELINKCNIVAPIELLNNRLNQYLKELNLKDLLIPGSNI